MVTITLLTSSINVAANLLKKFLTEQNIQDIRNQLTRNTMFEGFNFSLYGESLSSFNNFLDNMIEDGFLVEDKRSDNGSTTASWRCFKVCRTHELLRRTKH